MVRSELGGGEPNGQAEEACILIISANETIQLHTSIVSGLDKCPMEHQRANHHPSQCRMSVMLK
jgi:hypothetical protein